MGVHTSITPSQSDDFPSNIIDRLTLIKSRCADQIAPVDLRQLESFFAEAVRNHSSSIRRRSSGVTTKNHRCSREWHFYRTRRWRHSVAPSAEQEGLETLLPGYRSESGSWASDESVREQPPVFGIQVNEGRYFVYLPLARTIVETDSHGCRELTGYGPITNVRNIQRSPDREQRGISESKIGTAYMPTDVTLFPTSDCNLRCVYCYSSAGDNPHYMSVNLGKAAINQIVANALVHGIGSISVVFHGGGEPTLNWPLLTSVTEFTRRLAKALGINVHISLGTNGCMPDYKRDWILDNLDSLTLSLDGIAEVHNHQRQMRSGLGSFERAFSTLLRCEEKQFPYGIRTTVTKESASHLVEFVELLAEHAPQARGLQLEPVCMTGRALTNDQKPLHPEEFQEAFLAAKQHGKKLGYRVTNSTCDISDVRSEYCGAYGRNFVVTPFGEVTTCYEVGDSGDPRWDTFHIGRYDPEARQWVFNATNILNLQSIGAKTLHSCQSCYARYHCAGGCAAKNRLAPASKGDERCDATRALTLDALINLAMTASEQSWKIIGKQDLNLMKIQEEGTQLTKSDETDVHPLDVTFGSNPKAVGCRTVMPPCYFVNCSCMPVIPGCVPQMICVPEICVAKLCLSQGCTGVECTSQSCTGQGCTNKKRPGVKN